MTKATNSKLAPEAQAQASTSEGAFGIEALAEACGATPKDVRRWLRAQTREAMGAQAKDALPGKGGRYAFTSAHVSALAQAYASSKARKGTLAPASAILAALAPVQAQDVPAPVEGADTAS